MGFFDDISNDIKSATGNYSNDKVNVATFRIDVPEVYEPGKIFEYDVYKNVSDLFIQKSFYDNFSSLRFSKLYDYRFIVYKTDKNQTQIVSALPLPLNPTNIQIDVIPASNVEVTMKGIVENHNGAPLRRISIRGTTGVLPREPIKQPPSPGPNSVLTTVFKNTFSQAVRVVNRAKNIADIASSMFKSDFKNKAIINFPNEEINNTGSTGYDFIHTMMVFFDVYLAAKKQKKNSDLRLAFVMGKDRLIYDVSLGPHRYRKNPGTVEYEYDIELTAYRRKDYTFNFASLFANPQGLTAAKKANAFSQSLKILRDTRKLLADSVGLMSGIRSDIQESFLNPLREMIMLLSDATGGALTAAEFGQTIVNQCKAAIDEMVKSGLGSVKLAQLQYSLLKNNVYGETGQAGQVNGSTAIDDLKNNTNNTKPASQPAPEGASPINNIYKNPDQHPDIFELFSVDSMELSSEIRKQMDDAMERVRNKIKQEWIDDRNAMVSFAQSISESLGGGNVTYNRVYGLKPPKTTLKALSTDDIVLLNNLNTIIQTFDSFIATLNNPQTDQTNDYYKFYADFARANNITFENSNSKFYVPFPYGASLESLAVQYLNDSNRWTEIAAANGLKSPYIDEIGQTVTMSSSASGNQILLSKPDNLYIGQTIEIGSSTQVPTARKIISINIISSVSTLITVDGDSNLAKYTYEDGAYIKYFAPNTVNSFNMIAIPSQTAENVPDYLKLNPTPENLDAITVVALSDLALSSNGDLIINSNGNLQLSTGIANLTQAAKIKLLTKKGSIISDPSFGNPVSEGDSIATTSANEIMASLSSLFADDPRFGNILAGNILIQGPAVNVDILVGITGTNVNLPLSAELPL